MLYGDRLPHSIGAPALLANLRDKIFPKAAKLPAKPMDNYSADVHTAAMDVFRLTCKRCGYTWIPRQEAPPKQCPNSKCRSMYWDRPRRRESKAPPPIQKESLNA